MSNEKEWFSAAAGRRVTVIEIAKHLNVSRNTASSRLEEGLSSDEIIEISRKLHLNPVTALEELGKLKVREIWEYLETEGQLVETADTGYLALILAQRLNDPRTLESAIHRELVARREKSPNTRQGET